MIIRTPKRNSPYVMIDKKTLDDLRLSWKAKGLLAYLLSKPDNWRPIIEELAKMSKDSIDSVKSGLRELEIAGYLVRKRIRDNQGKITGWEHVVYENPQVDLPQVEKPLMGNPQVGLPQVENPRLINKEINNKEINNKKNTPFAPAEIAKAGAQCNEPDNTGKGEEYSADFISFWSHYPRKKEKLTAWKVWKTRIKEKVPPQMLITAAINYAKTCRGCEERFIKHPATFLGPNKPYEEYFKAKSLPLDTKKSYTGEELPFD